MDKCRFSSLKEPPVRNVERADDAGEHVTGETDFAGDALLVQLLEGHVDAHAQIGLVFRQAHEQLELVHEGLELGSG